MIVLGTNEQMHNAHLAIVNPDKCRSSPTPQIAELLPGNGVDGPERTSGEPGVVILRLQSRSEVRSFGMSSTF